jgi:hypothetical protein
MKKIVFIMLLLPLLVLGQRTDTCTGKIISLPNPCLTIPCLPGMVAGVEIGNEKYVLLIDSYWVWGSGFIRDGIEYNDEDEVYLTGNISSTKIDSMNNEYIEFEVLSIRKCNMTSISSDKSPSPSVLVDYNQGIINIHTESFQVSYLFEIFDITGKLQFVQFLNTTDNTVNIGTLNKGIYIYRLSKNGQIICQGKILHKG